MALNKTMYTGTCKYRKTTVRGTWSTKILFTK